MAQKLPSNVHISQHPCLRAKLSQLRSISSNAREVKSLIHDITLLLGTEALLTNLSITDGPSVHLPPSHLLLNH
jgi:uracil phosphoribosyltransferase